MKKFSILLLIISITLLATACTQAAPEPTPEPTPMEAMEHKMEEEGAEHKMEEPGTEHGMEAHLAKHGGQVGMAMGASPDGKDFHIEIVSDTPGQYHLYLTDNNREPVAPEGYEGTLAVIRPDGSEIANMPLQVMEDHLLAEGGPTDTDQVDVRISVEGPQLAQMLEMEFTLGYPQ